jgi:hypothetical protein
LKSSSIAGQQAASGGRVGPFQLAVGRNLSEGGKPGAGPGPLPFSGAQF